MAASFLVLWVLITAKKTGGVSSGLQLALCCLPGPHPSVRAGSFSASGIISFDLSLTMFMQWGERWQ